MKYDKTTDTLLVLYFLLTIAVSLMTFYTVIQVRDLRIDYARKFQIQEEINLYNQEMINKLRFEIDTLKNEHIRVIPETTK